MQTAKSVRKRRRLAWEAKVSHVRTTGRRGLGGGSGACVCVCEREREREREISGEAVSRGSMSGGKGILLYSLSTLPGPENRTWAQNTSSPTDRKPTRPMPSLSPHAGTCFPAGSSVCAPFFCFYLHPCPPANPRLSLFQTPGRRGWGPSASTREGHTEANWPASLHHHEGHLQPVRGQGPRLKLPLLFLHLRKGHSRLNCVMISLATPAPRFRGQKCLDFCSGG